MFHYLLFLIKTKNAVVAQSGERRPVTSKVVGSKPINCANLEVLMQEHQQIVYLLALLRNSLNYSHDTLPPGMPIG